MKVIFFRHSLLSRGGDKMIALHATHLAEIGHEVTIIANHVDTVFPLSDRICIERPPFRGKIGTLISAAVLEHNADHVVADIIPLACLLAIRNRKQTLYFAQDYDESYYTSGLAKRFIRLLYFIGLRLLKLRTIVVADHLSAIFRRRFLADAIVVENGVDTEVFYPEPDTELIKSKAGRRAVLLLSRNDARKGFDIAVQVMGTLPIQMTEEIEVWTVGEPAGDAFVNICRHRHFGYVGEERLRQLMSSADIFFYPSRHEGFPLMVVEAFACRCPVVTTEAVPYGRNRENALVGKIGNVKELTALLTEMLQDEKLRQSIVLRAEGFAKACTLRRCKEGFVEALQCLHHGKAEA